MIVKQIRQYCIVAISQDKEEALVWQSEVAAW